MADMTVGQMIDLARKLAAERNVFLNEITIAVDNVTLHFADTDSPNWREIDGARHLAMTFDVDSLNRAIDPEGAVTQHLVDCLAPFEISPRIARFT